MSWKNTTENYGTVARWLHWGTALLFLAAYATVYYRDWFTEKKTPENWTALQLHLAVGVTIGVLVALRILWRSANRQPAAEPGSRLQHRAAGLGHLALYAVMIVMPVTGYLGTGAAVEYFPLFDIPAFKNTWLFTDWIGQTMDFETFEKPLDFVHKKIMGEWLVWLLILGHALAALYHHYVQHDRTLTKMTTGN